MKRACTLLPVVCAYPLEITQATKIDGLPHEETPALSSHLKDASEVIARDGFVLEFLKSAKARVYEPNAFTFAF